MYLYNRMLLSQWRLHLLVQSFTFVLVPAFVQVASPAIRAFFQDEGLLNGSANAYFDYQLTSLVITYNTHKKQS